MQKTVKYIKESLRPYYPESEISGFTRIIIEYLTGKSYASNIANNTEFSSLQLSRLEETLKRLKQQEPIQHITGKTEFFGLQFFVNQDTLIPRPETEELVELILDGNKESGYSVLDIGTGSGCIAIALARYLKESEVEAWDFSERALTVAKENAKLNKVDVNFSQIDVLSDYPTDKRYHIIVSNPPYITESEKEEMEDNVLQYEPHSALFVPDNQPLLFYERIADIALQSLDDEGKLYFEINRAKGKETTEMLAAKGFSNIELLKDMSGNDRMISAKR